MKMGDWVSVQMGNVINVGYISMITPVSEKVQVTRVGKIKGDELEWTSMYPSTYVKKQLQPAADLLEEFQDKTVLIDLALSTRDHEWFHQLTTQKESEQ